MRLLKRILLILLIVLLAVVVFAAVALAMDARATRGRVDAITNTAIPNPNGPEVRAHVARPEGEGPFPTVIMIHEFWGLNEEIVEKADALSEFGYVVVAPDTYRGQSTAQVPRAIWLTLTTQQGRVDADLDAVFDWLESQPEVDPERIVVQGFCYGGGKALRYSLHNPDVAATAVFYGSLIDDPETLAALPGPVLGTFGELDTNPSPAEVAAFERALEEAQIPNRVQIFPGVGHAFVGSMEEIEAGGMAQAAWNEFIYWLNLVVGGRMELETE